MVEQVAPPPASSPASRAVSTPKAAPGPAAPPCPLPTRRTRPGQVLVKFGRKSFEVAASDVAGVRESLKALVGLEPSEMKLFAKGKTLSCPTDDVPPGSRLMLVKVAQAATGSSIFVSLRDVVSGRVATRVEVPKEIGVAELVGVARRSLRILPDECPEIGLYSPDTRSLPMRKY